MPDCRTKPLILRSRAPTEKRSGIDLPPTGATVTLRFGSFVTQGQKWSVGPGYRDVCQSQAGGAPSHFKWRILKENDLRLRESDAP